MSHRMMVGGYPYRIASKLGSTGMALARETFRALSRHPDPFGARAGYYGVCAAKRNAAERAAYDAAPRYGDPGTAYVR